MQSATVAFLFILCIQVCLYVYNAIDISPYIDRSYGKIRASAPPAVSPVATRVYVIMQLYLINLHMLIYLYII